jgi:hypothetical protein
MLLPLRGKMHLGRKHCRITDKGKPRTQDDSPDIPAAKGQVSQIPADAGSTTARNSGHGDQLML